MTKKLIAMLLTAVMLAAFAAACSGTTQPEPNVKVEIASVTQIPLEITTPNASSPVLDTAAPATREPEKPTPSPTPKPTQTGTVTNPPAPNYNIFSSCAFVGNSVFEGLRQYGFIPYGHFFTRVGLNIQSVYTQTTTNGSVPVIDELNTGNYAGIVMMFGQNELGWPNPNSFVNKYEQFLHDVWRRQPNAKLFIVGIPPVSAEKSATSTNGVTNENIYLYNAMLTDLCARTANCYFITVPEVLMTADGALPPDASGDGIHLNKTYSKYWADHICQSVMNVLCG